MLSCGGERPWVDGSIVYELHIIKDLLEMPAESHLP